MSISRAETILRAAKQQASQRDINESLFKAIDELIREVQSAHDEALRARRDLQVIRRRY
jgi:gamma-glutamyl:cysteine ligase YbdK (ATP-grasp superfamily)